MADVASDSPEDRLPELYQRRMKLAIAFRIDHRNRRINVGPPGLFRQLSTNKLIQQLIDSAVGQRTLLARGKPDDPRAVANVDAFDLDAGLGRRETEEEAASKAAKSATGTAQISIPDDSNDVVAFVDLVINDAEFRNDLIAHAIAGSRPHFAQLSEEERGQLAEIDSVDSQIIERELELFMRLITAASTRPVIDDTGRADPAVHAAQNILHRIVGDVSVLRFAGQQTQLCGYLAIGSELTGANFAMPMASWPDVTGNLVEIVEPLHGAICALIATQYDLTQLHDYPEWAQKIWLERLSLVEPDPELERLELKKQRKAAELAAEIEDEDELEVAIEAAMEEIDTELQGHFDENEPAAIQNQLINAILALNESDDHIDDPIARRLGVIVHVKELWAARQAAMDDRPSSEIRKIELPHDAANLAVSAIPAWLPDWLRTPVDEPSREDVAVVEPDRVVEQVVEPREQRQRPDRGFPDELG